MMEGTADPDAALAAAHAEYEAAMESSAHTGSDSSDTDDNDDEDGIQKARRRRRKPYPGYFFPQLSQQRMVYCLDVLKREDIKSVCEMGCGEGAVIRPMTNGASHSDSFPEPLHEETFITLAAAEEAADDAVSPPPEDSTSPPPSLPATPLTRSRTSSSSSHESAPRGRGRELAVDTDAPALIQAGASSASRSRKRHKSPGINHTLLDKYRALPPARKEDKELHLRRIAGLDIVQSHLQEAIRSTAPVLAPVASTSTDTDPFSSHFKERERWEDLRLEFWHGSLDVYNDSLDNYEAFVLTEVIEHLPERTLAKFPDIVFGNYRPRIVVVTTPNYDFNRFFELDRDRKAKHRAREERRRRREQEGSRSADVSGTSAKHSNGKGKARKDDDDDDVEVLDKAGEEEESRRSFMDPTGRTERCFRDDDHQFEWSQAEFRTWCDSITSKFEYTVELSGVGSLRNYYGKGGMRVQEQGQEQGEDGMGVSETEDEAVPGYIRRALASVDDPSTFFASQCAVFRRTYAYEPERSPRSPVQMPLAFYGTSPTTLKRKSTLDTKPSGSAVESRGMVGAAPSVTASSAALDVSPNSQHKMLKAHQWKASKDAGNPRPLKEIRAILDELMREKMRVRSCSLRELWGRSEVASACGGYINKIVEAIIADPDHAKWDIDYLPSILAFGGQMEDAVHVVLKEYVEPDWEKEWEEEERLKEEKEELARELKQSRIGEQSTDNAYIDGIDDDLDDDDAATSAASNGVGSALPQEGTNGADPQPKTKKQLKQERREQLEREAAARRAEEDEYRRANPGFVYRPPSPSADEENVWAGWEEKTNDSNRMLMTDEEWGQTEQGQATSGWD